MPIKPFRIISFILAVVILIFLLKVINWIPLVLDRDIMRKYSTIEEVKGKLDMDDIFIPSYFPQSLRWPPSLIWAQGKPFPAVIMEFRDIERGNTILVITQAGSTGFTGDEKIKIIEIKETVDYRLKGRDAVLVVGSCEDGMVCSQISWDEGEYRMNIMLKSAPFELIKIAESMLR